MHPGVREVVSNEPTKLSKSTREPPSGANLTDGTGRNQAFRTSVRSRGRPRAPTRPSRRSGRSGRRRSPPIHSSRGSLRASVHPDRQSDNDLIERLQQMGRRLGLRLSGGNPISRERAMPTAWARSLARRSSSLARTTCSEASKRPANSVPTFPEYNCSRSFGKM